MGAPVSGPRALTAIRRPHRALRIPPGVCRGTLLAAVVNSAPHSLPATDADDAMKEIPACPKCKMENTYPDGENFVCADCGHEWPMAAAEQAEEEAGGLVVKDANGNLLADGDAVILIKDLKLKGSSTTIKGGTKIRNIRLVSGDHEVDCKVDGIGVMLKACYLKKA